jgi:hypothetical protein
MPNSIFRQIERTSYPAVRRSLPAGSKLIDDEAIEDMLSDRFPGVDPVEVENFMRTLRKAGRTLAPMAQKALPGMIQGAVQGGMVAGPWGALAGAAGGGALSLLSSGGAQSPAPAGPSPGASQAGRAAPPATGPPPAAPGAGGAGAARSSSPVAQLLWLLSRPETIQALSALLVSAGRQPAVQVGQRQVPAAAFANAISEVAARVTETAGSTDYGEVSPYLMDDMGHLRCDISNPEQRTDLLFSDLIAESLSDPVYQDEYDAIEDEADAVAAFRLLDELDYEGDPMNAYEAALEGWDDDDDR